MNLTHNEVYLPGRAFVYLPPHQKGVMNGLRYRHIYSRVRVYAFRLKASGRLPLPGVMNLVGRVLKNFFFLISMFLPAKS